jgi:hypothetical protein
MSLYGAAAFTLIVMLLGTFSFVKMREAVAAQDRALSNQARALATLAKIEAERGSPATALRVALTTLPRNLSTPEGPYALEAEGALLSGLVGIRELHRLRHADQVSSVAFSPDSLTLATGSSDKTARLWPVGQGLIDRVCARVHDLSLSDQDKQRFGIEKEWCTPEVSAELRTRLGLDRPEAEASATPR